MSSIPKTNPQDASNQLPNWMPIPSKWTLIEIAKDVPKFMTDVKNQVLLVAIQISAFSSFIFVAVITIHGSPTNAIFPLILAVVLWDKSSSLKAEIDGAGIANVLRNTADRASATVDSLIQETGNLKKQAAEQLEAQQKQAAEQLEAQQKQAAEQLEAQQQTNSDLKTTVNTLAAAGGENLKQQLEALEKLERANLSNEQKDAINHQIGEALKDPNLSVADRMRWDKLFLFSTNQAEAEKQVKNKFQTSRKVLDSKLAKCGSDVSVKENAQPNLSEKVK